MLITIQKIANLHRWDYPDNLLMFPDGFRNPSNNLELIVTNNSGRTLTDLNTSVNYVITEYTGETPLIGSKLVGISALAELLPDAVITAIKGFALNTSGSAGRRSASSKIITRLHSNEQIDSFGEELSELLDKMVTHTALTQAQSDAILAALQE